MTKEERCRAAKAYREKGLNCAQCLLATFRDVAGLTEQQALGLGAGLGGGVRCGEICGSISGAVMAFGLAADQVTATAMTKQMTQSFREEFGCLRCQELVAKNGGKGHCAHMIAWGAQRAEEILAENKVKE